MIEIHQKPRPTVISLLSLNFGNTYECSVFTKNKTNSIFYTMNSYIDLRLNPNNSGTWLPFPPPLLAEREIP